MRLCHAVPSGASQKAIFEKNLEDIVDIFDELKKPMTCIKNGLGCWDTCMPGPEMEPTNSLGEQAV